MIYLVSKSQPNINALEEMLGSNDTTFLEMTHTFWCIGIPYGEGALKAILDSGAGFITWDHCLFVSANTTQWHTIVRGLLTHKNISVRKFGTLLIQSFPEIFKNLSTTMTPNGTLVLR